MSWPKDHSRGRGSDPAGGSGRQPGVHPDQGGPPPLLDRTARRWLGYGFELAGVIGLFTWGGMQADDHFGTSPWLTVSGFLFAFTGMTYLLIKETRPLAKSDTDWPESPGRDRDPDCRKD